MSWGSGWMTKLGSLIVMAGGAAKMLWPGSDEAVDQISDGVNTVISGGVDVKTGIALVGLGIAAWGQRRATRNLEKKLVP